MKQGIHDMLGLANSIIIRASQHMEADWQPQRVKYPADSTPYLIGMAIVAYPAVVADLKMEARILGALLAELTEENAPAWMVSDAEKLCRKVCDYCGYWHETPKLQLMMEERDAARRSQGRGTEPCTACICGPTGDDHDAPGTDIPEGNDAGV